MRTDPPTRASGCVSAPDTKTALDQAAEALQESARTHKRAEFQHRKQARELMRQLDRLRAECAARGIQLHIDTEPGGPQS